MNSNKQSLLQNIMLTLMLIVAAFVCIGIPEKNVTPAGDPDIPIAPRGACTEIDVICTAGIDHPFTERDTVGGHCTIRIPLSMCGTIPVGTFPTEDFQDGLLDKNPRNAQEAVWLCFAYHEAEHARQSVNGTNNCLREIGGFAAQYQCLEHFKALNCGSTTSSWSPADCNEIKAESCYALAGDSFSNCRCEHGALEIGQPCDMCLQPCLDEIKSCLAESGATGDAENVCNDYMRHYCRVW